jgi:hypothetical protein
MSETPTSLFSDKCSILSELWLDHKNDKNFADLFSYGNVGFPLAFSVDSGIIDSNPTVESYVDELWTMLMIQLKITDIGNFIDLEEVFEHSGYVAEDND